MESERKEKMKERLRYIEVIDGLCVETVNQYEETAPTIAIWVDDLYVRLGKGDVGLKELVFLESLRENDIWDQPNHAANKLYHFLHSQGKDVTGQLGF